MIIRGCIIAGRYPGAPEFSRRAEELVPLDLGVVDRYGQARVDDLLGVVVMTVEQRGVVSFGVDEREAVATVAMTVNRTRSLDVACNRVRLTILALARNAYYFGVND